MNSGNTGGQPDTMNIFSNNANIGNFNASMGITLPPEGISAFLNGAPTNMDVAAAAAAVTAAASCTIDKLNSNNNGGISGGAQIPLFNIINNINNATGGNLNPAAFMFPMKGRLSCANCRKLHIKCDRMLPNCSSCLLRGIKCEQQNQQTVAAETKKRQRKEDGSQSAGKSEKKHPRQKPPKEKKEPKANKSRQKKKQEHAEDSTHEYRHTKVEDEEDYEAESDNIQISRNYAFAEPDCAYGERLKLTQFHYQLLEIFHTRVDIQTPLKDRQTMEQQVAAYAAGEPISPGFPLLLYVALGMSAQRIGAMEHVPQFIARARQEAAFTFDKTCYDTACGLMFLGFFLLSEGDIHKGYYYHTLALAQAELLGVTDTNLYKKCLYVKSLYARTPEEKIKWLTEASKAPCEEDSSMSAQERAEIGYIMKRFGEICINGPFVKEEDAPPQPKPWVISAPEAPNLDFPKGQAEEEEPGAMTKSVLRVVHPLSIANTYHVASSANLAHLRLVDELEGHIRLLRTPEIKFGFTMFLYGVRAQILHKAGLRNMALEWADRITLMTQDELFNYCAPPVFFVLHTALDIHLEDFFDQQSGAAPENKLIGSPGSATSSLSSSSTNAKENHKIEMLAQDYQTLKFFSSRYGMARPAFARLKATLEKIPQFAHILSDSSSGSGGSPAQISELESPVTTPPLDEHVAGSAPAGDRKPKGRSSSVNCANNSNNDNTNNSGGDTIEQDVAARNKRASSKGNAAGTSKMHSYQHQKQGEHVNLLFGNTSFMNMQHFGTPTGGDPSGGGSYNNNNSSSSSSSSNNNNNNSSNFINMNESSNGLGGSNASTPSINNFSSIAELLSGEAPDIFAILNSSALMDENTVFSPESVLSPSTQQQHQRQQQQQQQQTPPLYAAFSASMQNPQHMNNTFGMSMPAPVSNPFILQIQQQQQQQPQPQLPQSQQQLQQMYMMNNSFYDQQR